MPRDYAERRAELLRDLDGLRVEVDPDTRIGTDRWGGLIAA